MRGWRCYKKVVSVSYDIVQFAAATYGDQREVPIASRSGELVWVGFKKRLMTSLVQEFVGPQKGGTFTPVRNGWFMSRILVLRRVEWRFGQTGNRS